MVNVLVLLGLVVWEFAYILKTDLKVRLLQIEGKSCCLGAYSLIYLHLKWKRENLLFFIINGTGGARGNPVLAYKRLARPFSYTIFYSHI